MNMNDDERKAFIENEKDFFKFHKRFAHFHDFFDDDEGAEQHNESGAKKDECSE